MSLELRRRDLLTLMLLAMTYPLLGTAETPASADDRAAGVPTLGALAADWMEVAALRSLPALNSACGSGKVTGNVLEVGDLSFPPLTMAGTTGRLTVDGQDVPAVRSRWFPHQVLRSALNGDVALETSVRLPYEQPGLLFHVQLTNHGHVPRTLDLEVALSAPFAPHTSWGWDVPRDAAAPASAPAAFQGSITTPGPDGNGWSCYRFVQTPDQFTPEGGGTARWRLTLPPGRTQTVAGVLAVAGTAAAARQRAWAEDCESAFRRVQADWQTRFDAMFRPGNPYFSGSLPRLVTADGAVSRAYYASAVALLSVCRTSFPEAPRVYVTNTPEYNCTMMYFWDTREWATLLALLDPAMLRLYLAGWLARGVHSGYAEEFLTGTLQGPWYSANDLSIFHLLDTYLNVTGDRAFLSEVIRGRTVLRHMEDIATYWKSLVRPGQTLADYGGAENLLECVPTYTHEVPSFNAANVWMMRRAAELYASFGDAASAARLRADTARLLPAVLALYVPGEGVWDSRRADGTRVPMRHVLDFVTVGQAITPDLTPIVRREMVAFVERELLVDHWMRAQSLSDPAAADSDRPDHGPMGAFTAWPAETIATFCAFGRFGLALAFLRRCATVLTEGPFSQSRELLDRTPCPPVRIALRGDQTYNASCGGSFGETIVRSLFGYQPDLLSDTRVPDARPREFSGTLFGIRYRNRHFQIVSDAHGLHIQDPT